MRRALVPVICLTGALLLAGCSPATPAAPPAAPQPAIDDPASIAAINEARKAFEAAYEAGDANGIGQLYAQNAVSEANFQPTLKGRDAIVASLKSLFEQGSVQATLTPDETRTLGNVGLDRGHYTVTVTPKAGAPPTTSQGRYLVIYVKDTDGTWRVSHDIDNAPGPVPAASAGEAAPKAEAR